MDIKYRLLADCLRDDIIAGKYSIGDRLSTEDELAERYSVSRQTVRQAISLLENEGYVKRRQGSGTYVSSNVCRRVKAKRIGFIASYITEYIFPSIIRGVEGVVSKEGYTLELTCTYNRIDNEKRILQALCKNPPDGLIAEGTKTAFPNPNVHLYNELTAMGVPIMFINGYYANMQEPIFVVTDDREGGRQAAETLIKNGHSRIGGIFKADDMQGHGRYAGFAEMMFSSGLDVNDDSVTWFTTETSPLITSPPESDIILNGLADCSAVVCYNDQIAIRMVELLQRSGRAIPESISVISFDNSIFSDISPIKITSLEHPKEVLGSTAASKLISMISGLPVKSESLPWVIREKDSVRDLSKQI